LTPSSQNETKSIPTSLLDAASRLQYLIKLQP
jgi:hypothetical protein